MRGGTCNKSYSHLWRMEKVMKYAHETDSHRRARTCVYCGKVFKDENGPVGEHWDKCAARKRALHKCSENKVTRKVCSICGKSMKECWGFV